jgi:hypothetical protein
MSIPGQSRHFGRRQTTSGLPPRTDIVRPAQLVGFVPTPELNDLLTMGAWLRDTRQVARLDSGAFASRNLPT